MASVFDDLDLSSVSIETQTDEASFVPERGLLGDIGSRFARGAVRTTALAGSALETLGIDTPLSDIAEEAPKKLDFLKPDVSEFLGKEGFISRGIKGGIESLIPSLSAGLPTGIAGAQIGSLLGPAGTAAGGVIGAVLGTVGLFGLGTYGEAKKEYLRENPDDFEGAHDFALRAGLIEGGVESLATGAEILTSGLAKGITTPLRTTIKTMLKSTPKEIATAYAKTAGIEVSTEVFQGVAEAQNRGEFGLETLSPVEAGMESIVPAMTMSFLFSSGSSIYNNRQQNKLIKNLQSDNPQLQKASNELIRKNLQKQDPEFAEAWSLATDESLRNGRPLDINADFVKLGNQLGEERAEEAIDRVRVADLEEDSLKLQSVLDEGRSAEDAFEEVYGGLGQEAEQTKALEKVAEIPGEVPTTKEKFAKAAEEAKKDLKPEDKVELFETPEQEAKQKVVDTKVTAEITAKVKAKKAPKTPKVSKEKRIEELTTKGRAGEATVAELTELGELRFGKEEFAEKRKGVDLGGAAKERRDKDTKEAIESVPGGVSELKVIQEAGLGVETSQRGALAPSETQEKVATVSSPTTKGGTIKWKQEETAKTRTDRSGIITGTSPKSGKSFTLVKQKGKEWALAVDGKAVGTFEREEAKKIAEGEIVAEGKEWKESGSLKGGDFKATSGIWEIRSSGKKAVHIVLNGQVIRRSLNGNKISVAKAKQFIKESDVKAPTVTKKGEAATREVKEPTAVTAKVPKKVPAEQKPSEVTEVKVSPEEEAKILKRSAKAQKKSFIADEKGRGYILEDLAALTYKAGMSLGAFAKKMRAALGKAYASIRNKIKSLYEAAQNHLDKVTLGREVGAIGGAKAATANKAKLSLAIALDKKGERPDNILADTGWFKPRDGKWRFFITDKDMKLQESYEELSSMIFRVRDLQANQRLIKKETMKMEPGDPKRNKFLDQFDKNSDELKEIRKRTQGLPLFSIITHPKLAKAYASVGLAKVKVNFEWDSSRVGSWEGSYDTRTNTISINLGSTGIQGAKDKRVRGTMIHEIQHAIQKIEGFTGGGSPESAATMNNRLMFNGLYARAIETKNTEIVDILDNKLTEGGGAFEEELQRRQKENPDTPEDILIDKLVGEELLKLYESNEDVQHLIDQDDLLAHRHENILVHASKDQQTYEAILGEMEANLADVTKDLTEQQVIQRQLSSGSLPLSKALIEGQAVDPIIPGKTFGQARSTKSAKARTPEEVTRIIKDQLDAKDTSTPTQKTLENTKEFFGSAADSVRKIIQPISTRLGNISPKLSALIKSREGQASQRIRKASNIAVPFLKELKGLSPEDYALLKAGLLNPNDRALADGVLDANPKLKETFEEFQSKVLDADETEADRLGLLPVKIKDWFPRVAKDPKAIFNAIKKSRNKEGEVVANNIDVAIRKQKDKVEKAGGRMTEEDEMAVIAKAVHNGRFNVIPKPGSAKTRQIDHIPSDILQYYGSIEESVMSHIYEMNEAIFARRLTGDSNRGAKLQKLRTLGKKIENTKDAKKRGTLLAEWERLNKLIDDVDVDMENSLAAQLKRLEIDPEKQEEAVRLIRARVLQRGTHGATQTLKNVGLALTIGNPLSAITQLGDQAQNIFRNKADAFGGMAKALSTNDLTQRFDLDAPLREFGAETQSSKQLDKVLKWSGLKSFDMFGKESLLQASLQRHGNESTSEFSKTFGAYEEFLEGSLESAQASMKSGKPSEDALTLLFAELSDTQPVSLSETSEQFLGAGNARIFWMLKQFALKQIDSVTREITKGYKSGGEIGAAKNFIGLVGLLGLAGAGTDEIKNVLLGREGEELSDSVMSNLMQLMFINRYALEQGVNSGRIVEDYLAGILIPPVARQSGTAIKDIVKTIQDGEVSLKSLANVPLVGRLVFDRGTKQGAEAELKRQRTQITESIRSGGDIAETRRKISRFNRKAKRTEGIEVIKPSSIRRIRKEEQKKESGR